MLFYKVWFCFGGVLEHALIFQYLSPQPDTNGEISSGFDEGPPSEKRNMLWLVNRLDTISVLPRPSQNGKFINITYQFSEKA